MRPDARVQAAIEVLDRWLAGAGPAEALLAEWGRRHRFAGSGDRRAIGDLLYATLRRKRAALWVAGGEAPTARALMIGGLHLAGTPPQTLFTGTQHAPEPLSDAEQGAMRPLDTAPFAIRYDLPDWLAPQMTDLPVETLMALGQRAPVDLRVNRLKAAPDEAASLLEAEGIATDPGPLDPDCLRVTDGAHKVQRSEAYLTGAVEIQDAASQAAARFAAAAPGETVLDYCAGGGGKTLAIGAHMGGRGRLMAHDISAPRLAQLSPRAERAGLEVMLVAPGEIDALAGHCDLVFVDASCTGSGAWRRNPEAKWALTPDRLAELNRLQDDVLASAAATVRPGGRLIYATCSLLEVENAARVMAFLDRYPDFRLDSRHSWQNLAEGDGFFAARLARAG